MKTKIEDFGLAYSAYHIACMLANGLESYKDAKSIDSTRKELRLTVPSDLGGDNYTWVSEICGTHRYLRLGGYEPITAIVDSDNILVGAWTFFPTDDPVTSPPSQEVKLIVRFVNLIIREMNLPISFEADENEGLSLHIAKDGRNRTIPLNTSMVTVFEHTDGTFGITYTRRAEDDREELVVPDNVTHLKQASFEA